MTEYKFLRTEERQFLRRLNAHKTHRKCASCGRVLPYEDFPEPDAPIAICDGVGSWCRDNEK
jgi:hypothetical protein